MIACIIASIVREIPRGQRRLMRALAKIEEGATISNESSPNCTLVEPTGAGQTVDSDVNRMLVR